MLRLSMMMIVIIWKLSIMSMVKKYQENGNRYLLCTDEKGKYTLKQCEKTDKKQESDETQYTTISEHVLEYNSYGDKLFYLKQENGNTELIQTDLNGNNEKF